MCDRRAFVFLLLFAVWGGPARATVLIPTDLGELSRDAVAIACGRVAALDATGMCLRTSRSGCSGTLGSFCRRAGGPHASASGFGDGSGLT
jgi:hypothetical protein